MHVAQGGISHLQPVDQVRHGGVKDYADAVAPIAVILERRSLIRDHNKLKQLPFL
jgi:hypothetical protein